jgi:Dipeptidase
MKLTSFLSSIALLCCAVFSGAQERNAMPSAVAEDGFNCFGIIAGSAATTDGCVLLAHNEDDSGDQMLNIYRFEPTESHYGYLWFEFPGLKSADAFMNEYGVCIASDMCASREDETVPGSVHYEIRTSAARHARSARDAVKIMGAMVERYGYSSTGRSYLVADRSEGWVCSIVRGKHWVAQRVPDDEIMVIPNYYVIGEVDLSDTENFMGSSDLIDYAVEKGWYNPQKDGRFNFRLAYSDPGFLTMELNVTRHEMAQKSLFGDASLDSEVVFSRKPARKVSRLELSELLTKEPLYRSSTVLTTVFSLDPSKSIREGSIVWVGYPSQKVADHAAWTLDTPVPDSFHRYDSAMDALYRHFRAEGLRESHPEYFFWKYLDARDLHFAEESVQQNQ